MKVLLLSVSLAIVTFAVRADTVPTDTFTTPSGLSFQLPATVDVSFNPFNVLGGMVDLQDHGISLGPWIATEFLTQNEIVLVQSSLTPTLPPIFLPTTSALLTGPVNEATWILGDHFNGDSLEFTVAPTLLPPTDLSATVGFPGMPLYTTYSDSDITVYYPYCVLNCAALGVIIPPGAFIAPSNEIVLEAPGEVPEADDLPAVNTPEPSTFAFLLLGLPALMLRKGIGRRAKTV